MQKIIIDTPGNRESRIVKSQAEVDYYIEIKCIKVISLYSAVAISASSCFVSSPVQAMDRDKRNFT